MTIAGFIEGRLAEMEQTARHVGPARVAWLTLLRESGDLAYTTVAASAGDDEWVADGNLREPSVVRVIYDPAQVLSQVAAMRAVNDACRHAWERYQGELAEDGSAKYADGSLDEWRDKWDALCQVQRNLAAIWSDHPDYLPEWAPETAEVR